MEPKPVDEEADTLSVIMDDEIVTMSEQEIFSVFDQLRLSSEDDRHSLNFDNFDRPEQTRVEIQVLAHTGTHVAEPDLVNA
jgi:hypothetical protein